MGFLTQLQLHFDGMCPLWFLVTSVPGHLYGPLIRSWDRTVHPIRSLVTSGQIFRIGGV